MRYLGMLLVIAMGCGGRPSTEVPPAQLERELPFDLREKAERVHGVVRIYPREIVVGVAGAALAPDTDRERIDAVRAALAYGDTAAKWDVRTRSTAVSATRLRSLEPGDTAWFHVRRPPQPLEQQFLAIELRGEIRPPGLHWSEAFRHIFAPTTFFHQP